MPRPHVANSQDAPGGGGAHPAFDTGRIRRASGAAPTRAKAFHSPSTPWRACAPRRCASHPHPPPQGPILSAAVSPWSARVRVPSTYPRSCAVPHGPVPVASPVVLRFRAGLTGLIQGWRRVARGPPVGPTPSEPVARGIGNAQQARPCRTHRRNGQQPRAEPEARAAPRTTFYTTCDALALSSRRERPVELAPAP